MQPQLGNHPTLFNWLLKGNVETELLDLMLRESGGTRFTRFFGDGRDAH